MYKVVFMTTIKKCLLFILINLITYQASGVRAIYNGIAYDIVEQNGETVAQVAQSGELPYYSGNLVIPSEISYEDNLIRVTSIGYCAFGFCDELTTVSIPSTVTLIGEEAFYQCSALSSITIPNSVNIIEDGAFNGCSALERVYIPGSVTSLYRNVFSNCPSIKTIEVAPDNLYYDSRDNCNAIIEKEESILLTGCMNTIVPNSVESIGVGAFSGCTELSSISFPYGLSSISFNAFWGCTALTEVVFPGSLWHIGENAFHGCTGLISLYIPKRTTSIGDNAFVGCSGIMYIDVDSDNYQYDSRNNCNAIIDSDNNTLLFGCKNTIIPNDVICIEESAFEGCTELHSITIPNSVTTIMRGAFKNCTSLQSIFLPDNITQLKSGTFEGCKNLETISIPLGVKTIDAGVFKDCIKLESMTIPSSVTKIGRNIVAGCNSLTTLIVEDGNTVYDSRVGCNAIIVTSTNTIIAGCKNTTIPNSVNSIGDNAFQQLSSLQSIDIPYSIISIGSRAFEECGLSTIVIPNSVQSIEEAAFEGCTSLSTILLPEGITNVTDNLFKGCTNLSDITIPDSVTAIGNGSFAGCSSLSSVAFPDNMESIGTNSFLRCNNLQSVVLPKGLKTVGQQAFYRCQNLESVVIPSGIQSIGQNAFGHCENLNTVISESVTPPPIGDNVFSYSYNATLFVPEESVSSYSIALGWSAFLTIEAIENEQEYEVTFEESNNGILIVAIDGEEIESGTKAKENSLLTILAIAYTDYDIECILVNGNPIDNSSSMYLTEDTHITVAFESKTNGIRPISITSRVLEIYNLSGQKEIHSENGINIIDGKKVVYK